LGAFGVLFLILVGWLQVASPVGAGAEGQELRGTRNVLKGAFSSFPDYMDPQLSYTTEGWTAMYETYIPLLTYQRADGRAGAEVIPGLAMNLPEVTDGGRTYTLFLRQGLRYSDGTPVRASDFEYAIKRLFKLQSGATPLYSVIVGTGRFERRERGDIRGITTDNRTGRITIRLASPSSTFTQLLAVPFAAPVPSSTPMRDRSFSPPPATGPYVIAEVGFEGWTYTRNPVWASSNGGLMPHLPDGHVDRIEVRVIRSANSQVKGVLKGEIDWMQGSPPPARYADLRRRYGGTQFRMEPTLSTYFFWMNTTKPPFSDRRVREAANYAVDRSVLRRIYGGQLTPSQQILPPGMPGYQKFVLYPYDLKKARRLVAKADPRDREVTVWTDTEPPHAEAAAYYQAQLRKIGLRAHLKVVGAGGYFGVIGNRSTPNLDTGWASWFADYPHPDDFFRPLLMGSSILPFYNGNFAQIDVPALDARVERLDERPLGPARERGYAALDRRYMRLAPWVPYGSFALSAFVAKRVDLDEVVWNPIIGADLASFQFE
jgi:peptide/nickel transport system substrate-binding protein